MIGEMEKNGDRTKQTHRELRSVFCSSKRRSGIGSRKVVYFQFKKHK